MIVLLASRVVEAEPFQADASDNAVPSAGRPHAPQGEAFRSILKAFNLGADRFAAIVDTSKAQVQHWWSGKRSIKRAAADMLRRIHTKAEAATSLSEAEFLFGLAAQLQAFFEGEGWLTSHKEERRQRLAARIAQEMEADAQRIRDERLLQAAARQREIDNARALLESANS